MKNIFAFLFCVVALTATAQKTTFDIATYTVAAGWTPEIKDFAASYVKTNNVTKSWCRVTIYKSIQSSGNPVTDFNNEWNALIVKNNWGPTTPPQTETETEDGWTSHSAVSTFTYDNKEAYSLLESSKYVHAKQHQGDREAIRHHVTQMDGLLHHVQDELRQWSRNHARQVGSGGIIEKSSAVEAILHHLCYDVGIEPHGDDEPAPAPGVGEEQAPAPGGVIGSSPPGF